MAAPYALTHALARNLSNLPGWRTRRHIVVFLVDDYGSIRMSSRGGYDKLLRSGVRIEHCRYNRYESIESNDDLEQLFGVLSGHHDTNGKNPVFTPLAIVANPDFKKIEENNYECYYWEPFTDTLKRYPAHDRVYDLWQQGIRQRIFVPEFHGREHLNVKRWMHDMRRGVPATRMAFQLGVTGIGADQAEGLSGDYQAAFDLDEPEDWKMHGTIVEEGLGLFERLFGYRASFFTPPNGSYSHRLDGILEKAGIKLINVSRYDKEPMGQGRTRNRFHYIGQRNRMGQRYIIRTAQFEPSEGHGVDWVDKCLAAMARAFRWGKPAIISSHRVNFCGDLVPENRANGLRQLDRLLAAILKSWPNVEFMPMRELGTLLVETAGAQR